MDENIYTLITDDKVLSPSTDSFLKLDRFFPKNCRSDDFLKNTSSFTSFENSNEHILDLISMKEEINKKNYDLQVIEGKKKRIVRQNNDKICAFCFCKVVKNFRHLLFIRFPDRIFIKLISEFKKNQFFVHEFCILKNLDFINKAEWENTNNYFSLIHKSNFSYSDYSRKIEGRYLKIEFFNELNKKTPFFKWYRLVQTEEMKNDFFEEDFKMHKKYDDDEILENEKSMGHEDKQEVYEETIEADADYNNQKICSEVLDDEDHVNQEINCLKANKKIGNYLKRKKNLNKRAKIHRNLFEGRDELIYSSFHLIVTMVEINGPQSVVLETWVDLETGKNELEIKRESEYLDFNAIFKLNQNLYSPSYFRFSFKEAPLSINEDLPLIRKKAHSLTATPKEYIKSPKLLHFSPEPKKNKNLNNNNLNSLKGLNSNTSNNLNNLNHLNDISNGNGHNNLNVLHSSANSSMENIYGGKAQKMLNFSPEINNNKNPNNINNLNTMSNSPAISNINVGLNSLNSLNLNNLNNLNNMNSLNNPNNLSPNSSHGSLDTNLAQKLELAEENTDGGYYQGEYMGFEEMRGNFYQIALTQNGSRNLQKFFIKCSQLELESVLSEIKSHITTLMTDTYANYMFQTLIQRCTPEQRLFILQQITHSFVNLACDKKGTHSIQALVSLINSEKEEELIMKTIQNDILKMILDNQGTHFVQKIVTRFKEERVRTILKLCLNYFIEVANNSGGVCVLKQLMTKYRDDRADRLKMIEIMTKNLDCLIQNPFGNYAIQHALEIFFEKSNDEFQIMINRILTRVVFYSNHKYSSNVVEKCILCTNKENKKRFISEIIKDQTIVDLLKNKYGKFVIQKCFNVADPFENEQINSAIQRNSLRYPKTPIKTFLK